MQSELCRKIRHYFELTINSINIHGCYYVSNRTLHISERIVWLLLIKLALFGTIYACLNQYNRFYERPTVMSVEKDFRSWEGTLPAITLCFQSNLDEAKAKEFADRTLLQAHNLTDFDHNSFLEFLDIVLNTTADRYDRLARFGSDDLLESLNLLDIIMDLRLPMEERVKISTYDPKVTVQLQPIMLEKGLCYTLNTAIVNVEGNINYQGPKIATSLGCRYGKKECFWKLDLGGSATTIDIHSPYEYSDIASPTINTSGEEEIVGAFKVMETVASESLRELSPHQRKCLYPDEGYPVFGKAICQMKCRSQVAMDMCNCVPHFYPYVEGPKCTPSGYECLLDFKWPGWTAKASSCNCPRTCIELQYPVLKIAKRSWNTDTNLSLSLTSSVMIELVPPKVRNRISVLFSFEDLLVSFGGAASLFLGFSFWAALQSTFYWVRYLTEYLLEARRRSRQNEAALV